MRSVPTLFVHHHLIQRSVYAKLCVCVSNAVSMKSRLLTTIVLPFMDLLGIRTFTGIIILLAVPYILAHFETHMGTDVNRYIQ